MTEPVEFLKLLSKHSFGHMTAVSVPAVGAAAVQVAGANERRLAIYFADPNGAGIAVGTSTQVNMSGAAGSFVGFGVGNGLISGAKMGFTIQEIYGLVRQAWFAVNLQASAQLITVLEVLADDKL